MSERLFVYVDRVVYIYAKELLCVTAPGGTGVRQNIYIHRKRCV